jgi:hypothetical protein
MRSLLLLLLLLCQCCATSRYVLVEGQPAVLRDLDRSHIGTTVTVERRDGGSITARLVDFDDQAVFVGGVQSQPITRIPVEEIRHIRVERINRGRSPLLAVMAVTAIVITAAIYANESF